MSSRSLNKVELIGNLTRDPELRYTPSGTAVCTFGLATNRQWTTESGERKEDVEFHRIVSWQKLAEICGKYLSKGRKVYLSGRIQTRSWTGQDGKQRNTTEIVIDDMIILDNRRDADVSSTSSTSKSTNPKVLEKKHEIPEEQVDQLPEKGEKSKKEKKTKSDKNISDNTKNKVVDDDISPDDIPF